MPVYRDHPRHGAALAAHMIYVGASALAAGSAAVFLLILIVAIVGEEAFGASYVALDPIVRASIGAVSLVLVGAGGIATFALGARRTATARQLARAAAADPGSIATWADRRDVEVVSPFQGAYVFGAFFLGFDALALLLLVLALQETFQHNPESAAEGVPIVIGAIVLGVIVALLLVLARKVGTPRWRDAAGRVHAVWNRGVRAEATTFERKARPASQAVDFGVAHRILTAAGTWLGRGALPVGGVGLVLFMIGVYLRQPCRICDERYFDRPIESFIDVVVVIGGPLVLLAVAFGILGLAAAWISRVIETARLRRLAADGSPSPKPAQLLPHLVGQGPAELLGIALIAASWPLVAPFVVARAVNGDSAFGAVSGILIGVGVIGLAVVAWSAGVDDGARNRFREAWSPGDPVPPKPDARRRTAPTRDAGDALGE